MNIPSMAKAIANGMGNDKLKFVMGDCCNFACIEIAYELRNMTDYVIGSPAEIPDEGAPYNIIIPDMFDESDLFYKQIIDHYYNYYLYELENNSRYYNSEPGDLKGFSVPLAAINTNRLENLASATAQILSTIASKLTPENPLDLSEITYYGISNSSHRFAYDMQQVLKKHADDAAYNQWLESFNQACPYHLYSQKWLTGYRLLAKAMANFDADGSNCASVSMFFPSNAYTNTSPNWNSAIKNYQWNNVIRWEQYGW